jgi:murein DD-endopeptidase MepM/ murein hydrolase activator NlpD
MLSLLAGLSFAGPSPQSTAPANADIKVTRQARSLRPGEIVILHAVSARPLEALRAEAFGREFPFFAEGNGLRWTGLLGIDLETKPGRYAVTLHGKDTAGADIAGRDTLVVAARTFPTRQLTVDEKFVTPPQTELARIREEAERVRAIFDTVTPQRYWRGAFDVPVPGPPISEFGKRNIYNGQPRSPHAGTDFKGASGTPVRAPNAGKVVLAAALYYSGNTVILDHGMGLYSYFGHLSSFSTEQGAVVGTGALLGKVGATGVVTGPHLHWSVRLVGTRVDPMSLLGLLGKKGTAGAV